MKDAMLEALKRRRGKGMELTIMLGQGPMSEEEMEQNSNKSDDMAPEMKMQSPEGEDPHVEVEMESPEMHEQEVQMGEEDNKEFKKGDEDLDEEVLGQMSDYEKQRSMSAKPKSLMERARQAALMRKK